LGVALLLGVSGFSVAGCGSSSSSSGSAVSATCTQISAVLADGPDPDADPVGYAQAQILPLRALQTSDAALHTAIDNLAAAYQRVVTSNNSAAANKAVTAASAQVDAICPGATS
jgi:hypothetical protein